MSFRARDDAARIGDAVEWRWEGVSPDGEIVGVGLELVLLAPDGRIQTDYQFIESLGLTLTPALTSRACSTTRRRSTSRAGAAATASSRFAARRTCPRAGRTAVTAVAAATSCWSATSGRRDLASLGRSKHFRAGRGAHGQGSRKHGERGEDRVVRGAAGDRGDGPRRLGDRAAGRRPARGRRPGGGGGHGNKRFATSTRQSPRFAERGLGGESGWIELRLKLLADVGLVGLPNAGKSSLLARLTRADAEGRRLPVHDDRAGAGTIELDDRQVVVADIPGLIEGAAEGAGLGHEFLAHVERCRLLVHLVEIAPAEGEPESNYETVRERARLLRGAAEPAARDRRALEVRPGSRGAGGASWSPSGRAGWARRSARCAGDLVGHRRRAGRAAPRDRRQPCPRRRPEPARADGEFDAEHRVYRPGEDEGFEVVAEGEGRWRVTGRGIELLVARHDLANPEALDYLEGRLREIGVIAELQRAGFERGDEVVVGEVEFELDPS